jgi:hypothetical protein
MLKRESYKIILLTNILLLSLFFLTPLLVAAQGGIVYECNPPGDCTYGDLIAAVKRAIDWMIIFTLEFSVVIIAYAGFNYMISGDNPGKRAEANKMLTKVAIGIFLVLAAWLIVTLIANTLLSTSVRGAVPLLLP